MTDRGGARLARALRGLLGDIQHVDLGDEQAAGLAAQIESLRSTVDGPTRLRWYEQPEPVDPEAGRDSWRRWSLFRGEHQPLAPPLHIERATDGDGAYVVGTVRCGRQYEGPPGAVHGGYLAGLFDDILGASLSLVDGPSGVTGRLTVRYRKPTPIEALLRLEARPTDVRPGRVRATAICLLEGERTAEADALFIRRPLRGVAR